ncbi:tetratricopeptide repeat-containing sensor histidine kinase [Reichenbachiella faecimaris]|nr:tetratricopeptide repeat-containing sensor histidine kinase [Reichenbachiella faecimaris]
MSQSKNVDSLEHVLLTTSNTDGRLNTLQHLFVFYQNQNHQRTLELTNEIISIADSIRNNKWLLEGYMNKASVLRIMSQFEESLVLLNNALRLASNFDEKTEAKIINKIGNVYVSKGDYVKALESYQKSLVLAERMQDFEKIAHACGNIGLVYFYIGQYEDALLNMKKSAQILIDKFNPGRAARAISHIGATYHLMKRYDSAIYYYRDAINKLVGQNDRYSLIMNSNNLAQLFLEQHQIDSANKYIDFARAENEVLKNNKLEIQNLTIKAQYFEKIDNFQQGINQFILAFDLAQEYNELESSRIATEGLLRLYALIGDYEQAFYFQKKNFQIRDSIFNLEKIKEFTDLRENYEIKRLKIEQAVSNSKLIERQKAIILRNYLLASVTLAFVIILVGVFLYRKKQIQVGILGNHLSGLRQEKNQLLNIVSHDLKNTLNNIHSIIEIFRKKNASNLKAYQVSYLSAMQKNVKRLQVTINNMLNINQLEVKLDQLTFTKVDIGLVLKEVLEQYIFSALEKRVRFSLDIEPNCMVYGDQRYILEVFDNLISNSIKYCPIEDSVSLRLFREGDEKICFSIQNRRKALSIIKIVENKIVTGNSLNLPKGSETSTGLGLFIVSEYISAMNGEIRLDVNEHFIIRFDLPVYS